MATFGVLLTLPLLLALAAPLPFARRAAASRSSPGSGSRPSAILWDTTMQQEIPPDRLSRVYSYDALGSWALDAARARDRRARRRGARHRATTLMAAAGFSLLATVAVLFVPRSAAPAPSAAACTSTEPSLEA